MDVARILFVLTFAGVSAGMESAFAAPRSPAGPVQHTAHFAGQGWANPGPTTAPTITATPSTSPSTYDRYGYPQNSQTGSRTAAGPPPSLTERAQNAFSETATTLRDGLEAGVRSAGDQLSGGATSATQGINQQFQNWPNTASQQLQSAGNNLRSAAEQTFGTAPKKPQYSNPFAPAPAPQPTTTNTPSVRKNLAPPPWPNSQPTTGATATSQSWPGAPAAAPPASGNVSAPPPSNAQNNYSWNGNASNGAAPPLAASQQTTPNNNVAPIGNTTNGNGSTYAPDSYRTQPSIHSPLVTTSQPANTAAPARTTAPADNWASGWDTNADTGRASIGRSANNASVASAPRNGGSAPAQPSATISAGANNANNNKSTTDKSTDSWANDIWSKPAQSSQGSPAVPSASAAITKAAQPATANNSNSPSMNQSPAIQPPANSPALNPPTIGAAGNANFAGAPPSTIQAASSPAAVKPNQPAAAPATGDEKPWVTFIVVILSLAGSLAANLFLGYSYMDARQKYQSLVRRTADTFRRTKAAAA